MSCVFQNIDTHPPLRPASVYPPPLLRGEYTLAGERGVWGSVFWETQDRAAWYPSIFLVPWLDCKKRIIGKFLVVLEQYNHSCTPDRAFRLRYCPLFEKIFVFWYAHFFHSSGTHAQLYMRITREFWPRYMPVRCAHPSLWARMAVFSVPIV
jgi:hypothetical protein